MEREFHKIKGLDKLAMKIIAASPDEHQNDRKCLDTDVPAGYYYDVRVGVDVIEQQRGPKIVRPYVMVGMAKVGERLQLENERGKPVPQKPPRHIEIPNSVKQNDGEDDEKYVKRLETMAVKNGIAVNDKWRTRPNVAKQSDIAEALEKQNRG